MVEGARLEIVWTERSRRFESSRFRHKCRNQKDSIESFYLFKVNLKKEDSLSSASSSQKCKHFFELLLEGESDIFRARREEGFYLPKSLPDDEASEK